MLYHITLYPKRICISYMEFSSEFHNNRPINDGSVRKFLNKMFRLSVEKKKLSLIWMNVLYRSVLVSYLIHFHAEIQ